MSLNKSGAGSLDKAFTTFTVGTLETDTISEKTSANGVTIDGVLLKDSEVTTDVINEKTATSGVTIDGLLVKDSDVAVLGYGKSYASQYTGDGATSLGITGVGFQPKMVIIAVHRTSPGNEDYWIRIENQDTDQCLVNVAGGASGGGRFDDDKIISLDADGFTVDDNGANNHPNTSSQVYDFVCFG